MASARAHNIPQRELSIEGDGIALRLGPKQIQTIEIV
jgi:hypothetical protein